MAEQTTQNPQAQAPQPRPCPRDCRKCNMQQQIFCTAQMTFNAFEQMNQMKEQLNTLEHHFADLSKKVDAIQSSEAELALPMSEASLSPIPSIASSPTAPPSPTPSPAGNSSSPVASQSQTNPSPAASQSQPNPSPTPSSPSVAGGSPTGTTTRTA